MELSVVWIMTIQYQPQKIYEVHSWNYYGIYLLLIVILVSCLHTILVDLPIGMLSLNKWNTVTEYLGTIVKEKTQ